MPFNEVRVNFLNRLNEYLLIMGIPGLLAISFLDSAMVPLAGGPDAVILLLAWRRPTAVVLIVLAATVGSTLGCLVLYGIGGKGGDKALSRFSPESTARIEKRMKENANWAIFASVLAPPPFPTKLVILAAGVLHTGKLRLVVGVFWGRLVRYSLIAYLAARFGDHAAQMLEEHYPAFSLSLIGVILLIYFVRKLRNGSRDPSIGPSK
jgi:membrane protein YqaA with SNARE-associated domain